jgi:DNA-binding NtrC family response regulator
MEEGPLARVLIVDDHRNTRESLAIGMTVLGIEADTASGVMEALNLVRLRTYDAIVSDVRMPDLDGISLCRLLRESNPGLRLILMTAYEVTPAENNAVRELEATLLIKPVTAAELAACCCGAESPHHLERPARSRMPGQS